ncbi:MAG: trans-sulfuration enzyme family protein [Acutalibacteraceae bacterium]
MDGGGIAPSPAPSTRPPPSSTTAKRPTPTPAATTPPAARWRKNGLLDGGVRAFAFASGLAAVTACFSLLQSGDDVVISDDIYGGTYRLLEQIFGGFGIRFLLTDFGDPAAVEAKLSERTKMVYFETPTNPMMRVADIRRIAALAKGAGAVTVVDNTFLTPYFQRPLELGADITLYSATKFLCGHHDTSAGLLVTSDASLAERLALISRTEGAALSPFDAFLIQRGMKTLALRMEKHQQNARAVTAFLKTQPAVAEVFYPGDEDSPYYALSRSQSTGFGGMLSFTLRTREQALALLERVKLIKYAESLGGTESLITYPLTQTHASTPAPLREKLGITDRLVRLSVGIEQEKDIIDDLFVALRA